jgi:hypothetical protein
VDPQAAASGAGLPRAVSLYGSILEQLEQPGSFASTLKRMLTLRRELGIDRGRVVAVPEVGSPGLALLLIELPTPDGGEPRRALTAVNFGHGAVEESLDNGPLGGGSPRVVFSTRGDTGAPQRPAEGGILRLAPSEAQVLLVER